jgi:predicted RNase H-like nuclease (RuvC/YqgF family)
MKAIHFLLLWTLLCIASPASATLYHYVDKQGITHYTNELSDVPVDQRATAIQSPEIQNKPLPESVQRSLHRTEAEVRATERRAARQAAAQKKKTLRLDRLHQRKAALEKKYRKLMDEKSAIDNDKSFQAKRYRYKYMHKKYIIALVKKEQELKNQLEVVEAEIQQIDTQIQEASR